MARNRLPTQDPTRYPQPPETLDVVWCVSAISKAKNLLIKWRDGLTPDADDLDAIEEILRGEEILPNETER